MNENIKACIFDIGGVLYHPDLAPRKKWEEEFGLSEGELGKIVFSNPITKKAKIGQATPKQIWNEVQEQLNATDRQMDQIKIDVWNGSWNTKLLNFIRSIKKRYKIGSISDAWPDARENIKEYVNYDLFDVILFSAEEGLLKPNPEIYLRALNILGVAPTSSIFIDDQIANVDGASQIGMYGIHYVNTNQVINEVLDLIA